MNQDNSSGEDIASQQSRDLTQLKKQIQLSNLQLLQLAYNDGTYVIKTEKFINHIHELNSKGLQCVINDQHRQAVIYFNQCQKILEYAASCGKAIDRTQIVVTLHNQACVNQKLWDLQKSANYLQAIIYNMNFYFQKPTNQNKQHNISIQMQLQQLCSLIHKKQMNALYYLQFCAVNSQIRKHTISLNSAKNAINIMKQVCQQSFQISQKIIYDDLHQINSAKENSNILKQLKNMKEELVVEDFQKYFQVIRQLMMERGRNLSDVQDQYKNIRTFSIGKLMQLIPITIQQMQCKLTSKEWVKHQNVVTLALYLGVCYFTVGTQLRFISSQNIEEGNQVYKLSQDFLISQVYHVYAIMIVLKYVPVKSIFLNHLLTSFSSHYEIDLDKFINNAQPQIKNSIRNQLKQQPGLMSYANSQQLHLAASMLPQQSSIKAQIHRIQIYQPSAPVKNQQFPQQQYRPKSISNFQPGISHQDSGLIKKKLSRNKSPKTQKKLLNKIKKTQNSSRSRSRRQNLKHQTFINIPRRLENSSKHENSLKNKSSGKMKSDFSPNKTKKSSQKFCIYTTKIKKDMEQANVNSVEKNSQKKSKSKQKTIPKLSKNKTTKQMKINQDVKKKSQSKQKITGRNVIGKLSKKSPSPKQKNQKQSNSKSKCNPVKQKMKMKMKKVFSKIADKQA